MSSIIKAGADYHQSQAVAFNFDDMTAKANEVLKGVRAEAARIIARAEAEAAQIRERAQAQGRQAGRNETEQIIQKQLAGQLETLLPALQQVILQVQDAKQAWLSHWEKTAVHVAAAIAGRLLRRELPETPEITLTLLREALDLAAGSPRLRIHMSPADLQTLAPQVEALTQELSLISDVQWIADDGVGQGGCRVETEFGVIDQQFEAQLARIEEELT